MSQETLDRDLRNRTYDRLVKWRNDTHDLYSMVDLPVEYVGAAIISSLIFELACTAVALNIPHKIIIRDLRNSILHVEGMHVQENKSRSQLHPQG